MKDPDRIDKIKLLVIVGSTATGKSDLAVYLADMIEKKRVGGYRGAEIISADSRQVYKGMDIGTGKITSREMGGITHHLLDVADPRDRFSVIEYVDLAEISIENITSDEKLPIICGGTGFYIDALINRTRFPTVPADNDLRAGLSKISVDQLFSMLDKLDHDRATHMNESDRKNGRRLIRAIEIIKGRDENVDFKRKMEGWLHTANQPAETSRMQTTPPLRHNYEPIYIGLQLPKDMLRRNIHVRLLERIESGMLDEARKLHESRSVGGSGLSWKRMEELGLEYRYQALYLQGKSSTEEMIDRLEIEIWKYAKRQMTWFKRNKLIRWFSPGERDQIEKFVEASI